MQALPAVEIKPSYDIDDMLDSIGNESFGEDQVITDMGSPGPIERTNVGNDRNPNVYEATKYRDFQTRL